MRSFLRIFNILYLFWGFISFILLMLLMLPFLLLTYATLKGKKATDVAFIFINIWASGFSALMFYRYKVINKHLIKKGKSYIFVVNHSSYLDAITIVKVIPQSFKPLGKIEMAKIPIFGLVYKKIVVLIDRTSKESREKCVLVLKNEIARGQSILIFPEGTMNKSEQLLGSFYDGAFKLAIETQTPILPVTLINTKEMMPRTDAFAIKNGVIKCVISDEIEVKGLKREDLESLKTIVFKEMEKQLKKYKSIG